MTTAQTRFKPGDIVKYVGPERNDVYGKSYFGREGKVTAQARLDAVNVMFRRAGGRCPEIDPEHLQLVRRGE